MADSLELYAGQYCYLSQRARIVLYESEAPFVLHKLPENGARPPKWFLQVSPHGLLPVLKHGGVTLVGCDDVTRHLEKKFPKAARLSATKKKQIAPTLHCTTTIEPLVEQLLDPINREAPRLAKLFLRELESLDSSLKGPFFVGSSVSMVDINYWTIFQKMPLLHYMHGIELTPFSNLRGWIDRMSKYASDILSLAKDLTKENKEGQLRQSLQGRGNLQPHILPLELIQIVNNALRRGVEELLDDVAGDALRDPNQVRLITARFANFEMVLREHSLCKTEMVVPSFVEKGLVVADVDQAIAKQLQLLKVLASLFETLGLHASLQREIGRGDTVRGDTVTQLLKWKANKLEEHSQWEGIIQQIQETLKEFNGLLLQDLSHEESIISLESSEELFSKYELVRLTRNVAFFPPEPVLAIHVPWVISHLKDPTQIRSFLLYYRFAMPFRFQQDILGWLKVGLPEDLWSDVHRQLEKTEQTEIHLRNQNCPEVINPSTGNTRKKTEIARLASTATATVSSALVDSKTALNDAKRTLSDDNFVVSNPIFVLEMLSVALKTRLRSVKDICTASMALVGLRTLEDSLNTIFGFLTVNHLYEEEAILPFIKRKSKDLRLLVQSASEDNRVGKECMLKASSLLIDLRMAPLVTPESMKELIDAVYHALSIELHRLYKQKQIFQLVYQLSTYDEQARLLREIIDRSPISFVNSMIPWLLKQMNGEKQTLFVMCIKKVLLKDEFEKLLVPIRKVLPVSLCNSLLSSHKTHLSM